MSNQRFQSLRGFRDIIPDETLKWQYVEKVLAEIATYHGFEEIRTPTVERTGLFTRSVGDTTDIVEKEMYSFTMGDEDISLRPEGTAGVGRAFLQHGMLNQPFPVKLFYFVNCYRHENPQAGRQREFNQFGVECYGSEDPVQDAEIIALMDNALKHLGVKQVRLLLNSIGCPKCRPAYHKLLVDYYRQNVEDLCDNCKNRLERNPLRLLDCKEEQCQPIKANAPRSIDHLCDDCQTHFDGLGQALDTMGIEYSIDADMVRGLDYYTRTVFEFVTDQIGAQGTVCGGGRYDGLIEELGGPATPGIGFAMGLERLLLVMEACGAEFPQPQLPDLYIGSIGKNAELKALALTNQLRQEGFFVLCDTISRSVKAQMRYADRKNAEFSCIIGDNEISEGKVEINNMKSGEKTMTALSAKGICDFLWNQLEYKTLGDDASELKDMVGKLLESSKEEENE